MEINWETLPCGGQYICKQTFIPLWLKASGLREMKQNTMYPETVLDSRIYRILPEPTGRRMEGITLIKPSSCHPKSCLLWCFNRGRDRQSWAIFSVLTIIDHRYFWDMTVNESIRPVGVPWKSQESNGCLRVRGQQTGGKPVTYTAIPSCELILAD